jgi:hypothetical protein
VVAPTEGRAPASAEGQGWTWRRGATIVIAFSVFLGAGVFVWAAFRPHAPTPLPPASHTVGPFGFSAAPEWSTLTTERHNQRRLRVAWASTAPWVAADLELAGAVDGSLDEWVAPEQSIESLPEDGIVIVVDASLYGTYPNLPSVNFPLQTSVGIDSVDTSWEGGPPREGISRGVARANINGWSVEARVYFGVSDPSDELIARANDELSRFATGDYENRTRSFRVGGDGATITMTDHTRSFSVDVPTGWTVADDNLTPWLSSPTEVLSVGTFDMPVSNNPGDEPRVFDAPVAPAALADMASTDAFVSLQESGVVDNPDDDRPPGFRTAPERQCCSARTGDYPFTWWWIPFIDQGRGFYLFVAIGNDANASTTDQAWAIADSLTFGEHASTAPSASAIP